MAIKNGVITVPGQGSNNIKTVQWSLANGDTGAPVGSDMAAYSDRSVQINGTFGAGGSVTIEGSNDGTNWFPLSAPGGTALTFTTATLKQVLEGTLMIRPNCTAGDGTTALVVTMMQRIPTRRPG